MSFFTFFIFTTLLSPYLGFSYHFASASSHESFQVQGVSQVLEGQFIKPKSSNIPTLIFLNGLTYEYDKWNLLVEYLRPLGYGIVQYDMVGQGQSLINYAAPSQPIFIENQVEDLLKVATHLGLTNQKLNLVGLSYGGGLAIAFAKKYPELIENAFLLAPYTEPVESQDKWIRLQIQQVRLFNPQNTASDEELYSFFLKQNVYTIFPMAEVSILSHPNKREAVFQLIEGVRRFNMFEASQLFPSNSVHLVIAGLDEYIPRSALERFWSQIPAESQSTKMVIRLSKHKLPEFFPHYTASWIHQVLNNKPNLKERTKQKDTLYDTDIRLIKQTRSQFKR